MPVKIEIQDIDHVFIDGAFVGDFGRAYAGLANTPGAHVVLGKAIREWHQRNEDKHQDDKRARGEKHAAEVAQLGQQHADAAQRAGADLAEAHKQRADEVGALRAAHEGWQAQQEDARKAKAEEHEAALQRLAQGHAAAADALNADLEAVRAAHGRLREAVKELGDTPTVLAMAVEAKRARLVAELDRHNAAHPVAAPDDGSQP